MSTTLPHGIIQINEGNISWYGDITANWQLIDSKIGVYDAAVASIPAPANNGTLTINYGGTTLAMFGADDAGDVSADIPAPGDGALTVTQGGSTLGSFSANQATPETIDIPAPGDGTLTIQLNGTDVQTFTANQAGNVTANIVTPAINNGTLTIRLNGVDVQTFTANQANDVVADIIPPVPGDGTLTIKVNGSTAGTFTANQSTAATANITVPTAVSELTNDSGYLTSSSNLDASKLTSGTVDIARLPQGALERLVKVANEAARYALTTADVQLGDTVQQLDTGIMYVVTDIDHLDSAAGYTEYTAGTAASVPWSGVTGRPTFAAVATSGAYSDLTGTPALATVATSGAYSDLTGTPTIPTVNNATLTIQKNGTTVDTFTANSSTDKTVNITVPTKTSDLTNDSNFVPSTDLATVATSGNYNDLSNKPTIPTVNNATLTIQKNGTTVDTFTANSSSDKTVNISVPTKTSDLNNDSGFITGVAWDDVTNKPSFATVATSGNYNDLSNKPTIPTVNNATLTIQKNGTNVQTFTANQSTNATANITVPTKTSDLTNDSGFLTLESLSTNSIPFHNAYPRCKYLGTTITDAQNTAIKNRTYDNLFIGDYWTINGVNWRIVAIDYYYNVGDTNFNKGNIIVMPDTVLYDAQMNTTNTAAGAYAGSLMRTQNLNSARTIAQNAFGSHLANYRILLANAVDSSGPSGWAWYDSGGVELPNEVQIYGTRVWGSALKGFDVATQKQQFPLMLLAPQFVNIRRNYWLQDVSSDSVSSRFALVGSDGNAGTGDASIFLSVRPSVTLSYI